MSTADRLLARILEHPDLVPAVQGADPQTFCAALAEVGLEDGGELLALATAEQIVAAADASLWRWDGGAERFDDARFVVWLEVLAEGGDAAVVQRLLELPEETLVLGFVGQLFVLDVDTLGVGMAGASWHEAELAERVLDACLYLELGDFVLVARRTTGWDAVVSALMALDREHHDVVVRVLDDCARASRAVVEEEGFERLLSVAETAAEDARAEKDDRRAKQGFVAPADAVAFLAEADATTCDVLPSEPSVMARAYAREYVLQPTPTGSGLQTLLEQHRRALPAAGPPPPVLDDAWQSDERRRALAFVANALMAAGRSESPAEAAATAVRAVERGITRARALGHDPTQVSVDRLFRLGWASLALR